MVFSGVQIIAAVQLVLLEPTVLERVSGFCRMGQLRWINLKCSAIFH